MRRAPEGLPSGLGARVAGVELDVAPVVEREVAVARHRELDAFNRQAVVGAEVVEAVVGPGLLVDELHLPALRIVLVLDLEDRGLDDPALLAVERIDHGQHRHARLLAAVLDDPVDDLVAHLLLFLAQAGVEVLGAAQPVVGGGGVRVEPGGRLPAQRGRHLVGEVGAALHLCGLPAVLHEVAVDDRLRHARRVLVEQPVERARIVVLFGAQVLGDVLVLARSGLLVGAGGQHAVREAVLDLRFLQRLPGVAAAVRQAGMGLLPVVVRLLRRAQLARGDLLVVLVAGRDPAVARGLRLGVHLVGVLARRLGMARVESAGALVGLVELARAVGLLPQQHGVHRLLLGQRDVALGPGVVACLGEPGLVPGARVEGALCVVELAVGIGHLLVHRLLARAQVVGEVQLRHRLAVRADDRRRVLRRRGIGRRLLALGEQLVARLLRGDQSPAAHPLVRVGVVPELGGRRVHLVGALLHHVVDDPVAAAAQHLGALLESDGVPAAARVVAHLDVVRRQAARQALGIDLAVLARDDVPGRVVVVGVDVGADRLAVVAAVGPLLDEQCVLRLHERRGGIGVGCAQAGLLRVLELEPGLVVAHVQVELVVLVLSGVLLGLGRLAVGRGQAGDLVLLRLQCLARRRQLVAGDVGLFSWRERGLRLAGLALRIASLGLQVLQVLGIHRLAGGLVVLRLAQLPHGLERVGVLLRRGLVLQGHAHLLGRGRGRPHSLHAGRRRGVAELGLRRRHGVVGVGEAGVDLAGVADEARRIDLRVLPAIADQVALDLLELRGGAIGIRVGGIGLLLRGPQARGDRVHLGLALLAVAEVDDVVPLAVDVLDLPGHLAARRDLEGPVVALGQLGGLVVALQEAAVVLDLVGLRLLLLLRVVGGLRIPQFDGTVAAFQFRGGVVAHRVHDVAGIDGEVQRVLRRRQLLRVVGGLREFVGPGSLTDLQVRDAHVVVGIHRADEALRLVRVLAVGCGAAVGADQAVETVIGLVGQLAQPRGLVLRVLLRGDDGVVAAGAVAEALGVGLCLVRRGVGIGGGLAAVGHLLPAVLLHVVLLAAQLAHCRALGLDDAARLVDVLAHARGLEDPALVDRRAQLVGLGPDRLLRVLPLGLRLHGRVAHVLLRGCQPFVHGLVERGLVLFLGLLAAGLRVEHRLGGLLRLVEQGLGLRIRGPVRGRRRAGRRVVEGHCLLRRSDLALRRARAFRGIVLRPALLHVVQLGAGQRLLLVAQVGRRLLLERVGLVLAGLGAQLRRIGLVGLVLALRGLGFGRFGILAGLVGLLARLLRETPRLLGLAPGLLGGAACRLLRPSSRFLRRAQCSRVVDSGLA
ncbi:hypothetical protein APY03_0021 [Variovorax sp. WDL1]|nr:hypothetical protein APY03_0021 [Variovorax sp. WDL1]